MCPSLTDGRAETVLVDGPQQTTEAGERGAPARVLHVVTGAVYRAVLCVKAHVGTVDSSLVLHAARHVSHQLQLLGRQDVVVREVCNNALYQSCPQCSGDMDIFHVQGDKKHASIKTCWSWVYKTF